MIISYCVNYFQEIFETVTVLQCLVLHPEGSQLVACRFCDHIESEGILEGKSVQQLIKQKHLCCAFVFEHSCLSPLYRLSRITTPG